MDREERIRKEVEETISSMDNIETLDANPYLHTRINARLKEDKLNGKASVVIPAFLKPLFFVLLVTLNVYSVYNFYNSTRTVNSVKSEYLEVIQEEYLLNDASYYTYNILRDE